jgi:transcriptional regulator with XRE-family HTH domain
MTGKKIRELRKALGLSYERAAAEIEVSERTWRRWENDEFKPLPVFAEKLKKLAEKAGIKV